jgi:hypothetical protein
MLTVLIVIIILLAIVTMLVVAVRQSRSLKQVLRLEINNQGNVRSRYEFKAEEPQSALTFLFTLDGDPLPEGALPSPGQAVGAASLQRTPVSSMPAPGAAPAAQDASQAAAGAGERAGEASKQAQERAKQAQERAKQAQAGAKKAAGLAGAVGALLSSVGRLLPGSAGQSLMKASSEMRRGSARVDQAQKAPGRMGSQVKKAQTAASSAKKAAQAAPVPKEMPGVPSGQPASAGTSPPLPASSSAPAVEAGQVPPPLAETGWVQTPSVEPGGTLALELLIKPVKPGKVTDYRIQVVSRSAENRGVAPLSEEWAVQLSGVTGFRRYQPYLWILAIAAAAMALSFWLASTGLLS